MVGLRPRAVVSFPGRWWHHNDLNLGINSYNNNLQWTLNWNSYIFIKENAFQNVVWEMAAILSEPQHAQCIND